MIDMDKDGDVDKKDVNTAVNTEMTQAEKDKIKKDINTAVTNDSKPKQQDEYGYLLKVYEQDEKGNLYNPFSDTKTPYHMGDRMIDNPTDEELSQNEKRYSHYNNFALPNTQGQMNKIASGEKNKYGRNIGIQDPHIGFSTNGLATPEYSLSGNYHLNRFADKKNKDEYQKYIQEYKKSLPLWFQNIVNRNSSSMSPEERYGQNAMQFYKSGKYDVTKNIGNDEEAFLNSLFDMVRGKEKKRLNGNDINDIIKQYKETLKRERTQLPDDILMEKAKRRIEDMLEEKYGNETNLYIPLHSLPQKERNVKSLLQTLKRYYDDNNKLVLVRTPISAVIRNDDLYGKSTAQRDTPHEIVSRDITLERTLDDKKVQRLLEMLSSKDYTDRDLYNEFYDVLGTDKLLSDENKKFVIKDLSEWAKREEEKYNSKNNILNGIKMAGRLYGQWQ